MSDGLNWFIELAGESADALPVAEETPPPLELRPGDRIAGRFELLEQLGQGGMGVVHHARELASGRSVAIKLMTGRITSAQRERFRREGVVTASLQHPGIVAVHGAGAVNGSPYLVYEYVPGGRTFRDLMKSTPRAQLLSLLRDAAEALGAAHDEGVIHRDVKPGNLLVDPEGRVRVADFGLVRAVGLESMTKSGEMLGTPLYMPREQFEHDGTVGPTADVWSLGVILHEVLTGAPPFEVRGLVELVGAIQNTPINPHRFDPNLEPGLVAICKRALRRTPSDRYPDATAFAADLSRFLDGAEPLTLGRARRRNAGLAAGVGVVAIGVAVAFLSRSAPAGDALARTLSEAEAGRANAAAVASALAASPNAPPTLRAAAHMRLAVGASADRATWEGRLAHARQAAELDPTRAAAANSLAARALVELGRYREAAPLFDTAPSLGRDPARVLEHAARLVDCEQWDLAGQALEAYRAVAGTDRLARRLTLEVAAATAGQPETIAAQAAALGLSRRALVQARVAASAGTDPLTPLRARAIARPGEREVSAALIRLHLAHARLAEAQHALVQATAAGYAPPPRLAQALTHLRDRSPEPAKHLPRAWKLAIGRGLARLARRELDLARQREDPRYESGADGPSTSERRARVRRYLAFVRDELATEGLEPPAPRAPTTLTRVRTLVRDERHAEALTVIEQEVARRDYDLGSFKELRAAASALAAAQPDLRKRLLELTTPIAPRPLPADTPGVEDSPRRGPPYDWNGLYRVSALGLRTDTARALPAMVLAASRAPRLLKNLRNDLYRFTRSNQIVGSSVTLATLATQVTGTGWPDRLARATLGALAIEWEAAAPTTLELDQALAEAPGVVFARVLRAMVCVKAGRLVAAREDLAVVREVFPDDLYTTALVQVLLLAKAGAPAQQVLAALRKAHAKGFRVKELWKADDMPELVPYMKHEEIGVLLGQKPKRRRDR